MKYYNLVFIKHQMFGKMFLFQLPMQYHVEKKDVGKEVLCETKRGEQVGTIASENFIVHERAAKAISDGCGGYWPVAPVLGITKRVITAVTERFPSDADIDGLIKVEESTDLDSLPFY